MGVFIDLDNPCTRDCPDRPNCKGCVRGNEYRQKRIKRLDEEFAKKSIDRYEQERWRINKGIAAKNSKKPKRRTYRD